MKTELLKYMSKFPSLGEEDTKLIVDNLTVQSYKKGTILIKEGEKTRECYFILKGCIRQYFLIDGEEKTASFFTEEQAVVSVTHYAEQLPSNNYLACVEDCILIVGNP